MAKSDTWPFALSDWTVDERFVADVPERLIGDQAYDSDGLDDQMLREYGTEVIAPHRCNRRRENVTQDGRARHRHARRWKIERFFAGPGNHHRLVVRWEYHVENHLGFLHLASAPSLLKHL